MTKLLILSDSHGSTDAVRRILTAESDADAVIFLGDGLHDLEKALTATPKMRVYSVAGNCDFGALEPLDGLWTPWPRLPPPGAPKWPCSATPMFPCRNSGAPSSCLTPAPAAGVMWAPTPTASWFWPMAGWSGPNTRRCPSGEHQRGPVPAGM